LRSIGTAIIFVIAAIGFSQSATAQNPPTPAPPFLSPFNGDRDATAGEAQDFGKLMDVYDAMKDAEAKLKAA
jgi:hypothetical protein